MVEEWVPRQEPKRKLTEEEQRQAEETLAYLDAMPWRPFGEEW